MKANFFRKAAAAVIDTAAVGAAVVILPRLLSFAIIPDRAIYAAVILFTYYCAFYLRGKSTWGQRIAGLRTEFRHSGAVSVIARELLKIIFILLIPYLLSHGLEKIPALSYIHLFICFGLYCLMLFLCPIIWGRLPWSMIIRTEKQRTDRKVPRWFPLTLVTSLLLFCFVFLLIHNNSRKLSEQKLFGFEYPFRLIERPADKKVQPYLDYLRQQQSSPKDYVLSLFEDYDIVILEEGRHGNLREWDLIYDIVTDDYFVKNVGTIFTEYGGSRYQEAVDTLLNTVYENDEALSRAVMHATSISADGYCFYNFLKKLNCFNRKLPDSLRIRECPTDIQRGKYFSLEDYTTDSMVLEGWHRDSLMAKVTIDWYRQQHRKCLVVTNTCHSQMVVSKDVQQKYPAICDRYFNHSQAHYINDCFPGRVTNVMYYDYGTMVQNMRNGIWASAFRNTAGRPVGFNLEGNVFGNDIFDNTFIRSSHEKLKFKDIYHGIVFFTREYMVNFQALPHLSEAARQEYDELMAEGKIKEGQPLNAMTGSYGWNNPLDKSIEDITSELRRYENISDSFICYWYLYKTWWHYADIYFEIIWLALTFLLCIGYAVSDGLRGRKRKRAAIPAESRSNTERLKN